MNHPLELAQQAAGFISAELGDAGVAVVLGSGWAAAAENLGVVGAEFPLDSIPGAAPPAVEGHSGLVRSIDVQGVTALLFGGRTHLYEGHGPHDVVHAVRAAVLAGCKTVILTNAAGSLDPRFGPGQPVMIRDQLNLTGTTPLLGEAPPKGFPGRFADVTEIYSSRLRGVAMAHDPSLGEGVYAGLLGGVYETPAEVSMLATLGATLVGMSTVLESIAAKHLGAEVAGISLVTNLAAGLGGELSHEEVLEVAEVSTDRMVDLVAALIVSS